MVNSCIVCMQECDKPEECIYSSHCIQKCLDYGSIHSDCLYDWYKKSLYCPICRDPLILTESKKTEISNSTALRYATKQFISESISTFVIQLIAFDFISSRQQWNETFRYYFLILGFTSVILSIKSKQSKELILFNISLLLMIQESLNDYSYLLVAGAIVNTHMANALERYRNGEYLFWIMCYPFCFIIPVCGWIERIPLFFDDCDIDINYFKVVATVILLLMLPLLYFDRKYYMKELDQIKNTHRFNILEESLSKKEILDLIKAKAFHSESSEGSQTIN